ncbi:MAG: competence/damage-inducible protein A [Clostridia bacterium]|nr:competence/damage-inducible protein A [Clostridia bacterium]
MKSELISVGTEILLGEILNTDAQFLAGELSELGIDVYHQSVVGDNAGRLAEALKTALSRSDIVIASGGLGPTPDDITKEVIAETMGEKLILHEESLRRMQEYFNRVHREMCKNNIKQAMLPEHCIVLNNNNGTAPGCIIEKDGKTVIMLPGPPAELTRMFSESVRPYLEKRSEDKLFTRTYHIFGKGESAVAAELSELMEKNTNPTVAPYAKTGEVHLRLGAKAKSQSEADKIMESADKRIRQSFGRYIYSTDGKSLPEVVFSKLLKAGKTICTAESCTGGLIAKTITDFPGSSGIFSEGYVTYSNEAKIKNLGVKRETLQSFGAVSEETAGEMAEGAARVSGADIGVSVTGIAGPDGGTPEKPVGLVFIAVCFGGRTEVRRLELNGDRDKIRYLTMLHVFSLINERL